MKTLIISLLAALGLTASAQTNVYLTNIKTNAKTSLTCGGKQYSYVASGLWRNSGGPWYGSDTNIMSISFTNPAALLQWSGQSGGGGCGHTQLFITNNNFAMPFNGVSFSIFVSNSIPWHSDTNTPIGLTTVGFTNAP